jgi:hypothetical protein
MFDDSLSIGTIRDNAPIPMPPERGYHRISYLYDVHGWRQARDMLHLDSYGPALDVNRFGEVPVSLWYAGQSNFVASVDPGPEAYRPWIVTGLKVGGRNPGFVFQDTRGVRYICKFDKQNQPIVSTAAGAVAAHLFGALGYHIPDDRIVSFQRAGLSISPDATIKNSLGEKRPLTEADIDQMLEGVPDAKNSNGYRALVSRFLNGRPRGGYSLKGVNKHDPNDRIKHQNRRSLRAIRVFGAWLQHVDTKEDNTLDLYVGQPGEGHLMHYLVDFDGCLGGYWSARQEARIGYAHDFDQREFWLGIPSFGLGIRPYEDIVGPEHPHVGVYTDKAYDPSTWRPNYTNDQIIACGPADAFWAGRVLAGIDDETVAIAVAKGRYPDPNAASVLTRALIARRDKTLLWSLSQVSPAVELNAVPHGEAFDIDAVSALAQSGFDNSLDWKVEIIDPHGHSLAVIAQKQSSPAVSIPASATTGHIYLVVRWTATDRQGHLLPPTDAHYSRRQGVWMLVGVTRDGA